jgi:hypothetical protein
VSFSGPPSEPDVRLSPHPALHVLTQLTPLSPVQDSTKVSECVCPDSGTG